MTNRFIKAGYISLSVLAIWLAAVLVLPVGSMAYLSKSVHTDVTAGTTTYVVSFAGGMQPTDDIEVWVNGTEATSATVTWLSGSTLQLNGYIPVEGDDIEFRRVSPKDDNLVDLEAGKTIRAVSLMKNFRHTLQVAQEAWDKSDADSAAAEAAAYAAEAAISADIIEPTKFAYNVDSIAALRLTPATEYTTVYLRGHTSLGDGGQGVFRWNAASTAADDNGVTIAVTGVATGRWVRQYSGAVNVKWFGAKGLGNNLQNDTPAIQAAMNCSNDVYIPEGVYVLYTPLVHNTSDPISDFETQPPYVAVNKANGIHLRGAGANKTVLVQKQSGFSGTSLLYLNGNSEEAATIENPMAQFFNKVEGIHLKGVSKNLSGLAGLRLRANMYCTYNDVVISNLHTGIYIEGNGRVGLTDVDTTSWVSFKNVYVHDCIQGYYGRKSRQGNISFDTCGITRCDENGVNISVAGLVMTNCNISSNGIASAISGGVVIGSSITASQNRGVIIQGCIFENNNRFHIKIGNLSGGVIQGNSHHPYANYGAAKLSLIFIEKAADSSIIDGIDISGDRVQPYGGTYYATTPLTYIEVAGIVTNVTESATSLSDVGAVATPYTIATADPKELTFNSFDNTAGSNANGSWRKYSDGTAECHILKEDQSATWTAIGAMFRSNGQSYTLPITLADTSYVEVVRVYDAGVNYGISASGMRSGKLTTSFGFFLFSPTNVGAGTYDVEITVRGRWK